MASHVIGAPDTRVTSTSRHLHATAHPLHADSASIYEPSATFVGRKVIRLARDVLASKAGGLPAVFGPRLWWNGKERHATRCRSPVLRLKALSAPRRGKGADIKRPTPGHLVGGALGPMVTAMGHGARAAESNPPATFRSLTGF